MRWRTAALDIQRAAVLHRASRPIAGWNRHAPYASRRANRAYSCRAGNDEKQPLVALVAWLGAKPRNFLKYVELWQSLGHPTYSIMPPTSSILLPPLCDRQASRFLADLEQQREAHPGRQLLLHIFSNAGFLFTGTALRLLAAARRQETSERLPEASWLTQASGIIFDSAPARLTPDISARGFTAAALGQAAEGIEHRRPRLVAAARQVFSPILGNPYFVSRQDEIWKAWETQAPVSRQLYLYSKSDALIPPQEVQRFQQSQVPCQTGKAWLQVARGVASQQRLWEDSPHCEHLRVHPREYRELITAFSASLLKVS